MSKRGMRLVLLVGDGCEPCENAKALLKKYIERGEIEVLDVKSSDEAADLYIKSEANSVPQLLVVSKDGEVFAKLPVFE